MNTKKAFRHLDTNEYAALKQWVRSEWNVFVYSKSDEVQGRFEIRTLSPMRD
jgi:hypothetical protein